MKDEYEYILIDRPPLAASAGQRLAAAEAVLIPLQCEYYAMEGLAH